MTAERAVFARADAPYVANTAGAGDAALAGFLLGLTRAPAASAAGADALAVAAACAAEWGAHAVAHASTGRGGAAARHPGPRRDLARPLARADRRGG